MLTAADVMTIDVISVALHTPLREIAKLMYTHRISGVPVIDRGRYVVGMVSEGDLLRHSAFLGEQRPSWWSIAFTSKSALAQGYIKTHGQLAGEIMTAPAIGIAPAESLAECARIMQRYRIKRLVVVDNEKLVGIVTRGNLLQGLATPDDGEKPASTDDRAIRVKLVAELERQRWADLLSKDIVVRNGIVRLGGVVESEEERHALRVVAANVPGVKRVKDRTRTRPLFRMG
jgi:CBS domain-containing protein